MLQCSYTGFPVVEDGNLDSVFFPAGFFLRVQIFLRVRGTDFMRIKCSLHNPFLQFVFRPASTDFHASACIILGWPD